MLLIEDMSTVVMPLLATRTVAADTAATVCVGLLCFALMCFRQLPLVLNIRGQYGHLMLRSSLCFVMCRFSECLAENDWVHSVHWYARSPVVFVRAQVKANTRECSQSTFCFSKQVVESTALTIV